MPPDSFSFLLPPDPPAAAEPDGGSSGTNSVSSAPFSMDMTMSSLGRGIGELCGVSMAQLSAIVGWWVIKGKTCRECETGCMIIRFFVQH